ncbi:MAG TPA: flavin reductase family protein [Lacibacter sp.]|nr:flavin reductase family protein [Lacibacter sp.]HMO87656.1 flavin reductase family protein [Lacibacter sp.]HMP86948.1 flavin reductase family protein [Lacibacter sp.]
MSLRKKPWNRTNQPVYSVSSRSGDAQNMHILTYATAISMQPKRFIVGIYHGTRTLELVEQEQSFVLQLLAAEQYPLVKLLGQQSGKKVDKISRLEKRKLLVEWNGYAVLKGCLAVMELQILDAMDAGDHKAFLCDVVQWKNLHTGTALTLDVLREKGIIRA